MWKRVLLTLVLIVAIGGCQWGLDGAFGKVANGALYGLGQQIAVNNYPDCVSYNSILGTITGTLGTLFGL